MMAPSISSRYSAPLVDMTIVLPKGSADIAATDSGKTYHLKVGDIPSHAKYLYLKRHVNSPSLNEFQTV